MSGRYLSPTGLDVYFIRHGESTNNVVQGADRAAYELVRDPDPGLSPLGKQQGEHLGRYMAHNPEIRLYKSTCHIVFTSPMRRAVETAHKISKYTEIQPEVWTDLFENKGCQMKDQSFPGLTRSGLLEKYPHFVLPDSYAEEGWFLQPIETEAEAYDRAQRVITRLSTMSHDPEYQGKSIGVVTHGNFMDYLFGRLVNRADMKGCPKFIFSNTCYSRVHFRDPVPVVLYLDRNEHLSGLVSRYESTIPDNA